jgi:hypothetical protein
MAQIHETPPWRGRRSDDIAQAGCSGKSEDSPAGRVHQVGDADPLRIIRTHWGIAGPAPFGQVGNAAAEIAARIAEQIDITAALIEEAMDELDCNVGSAISAEKA